MSGFAVEIAAVHAAGHHLTVVADDLGADYAVLRTQLETLVDGGWSGAAARSFARGWTEWTRGYQEAETALRQMARALQTTATDYEQAEGATHDTVLGSGGDLS